MRDDGPEILPAEVRSGNRESSLPLQSSNLGSAPEDDGSAMLASSCRALSLSRSCSPLLATDPRIPLPRTPHRSWKSRSSASRRLNGR